MRQISNCNVDGVVTELASASHSFSEVAIYQIDVEAKDGQIKVTVTMMTTTTIADMSPARKDTMSR